MEKRYSQMTEYELRQEIASLGERAKKAEQMGMISEFSVYERKAVMARAYLMDPSDFKPDHTYEMTDGSGELFKISYMNGTFAWGYRAGNKEMEAFPISLLKDVQKGTK